MQFLKKTFFALLELSLVAGLLFYIAQKKGIGNFSQIAPAVERAVNVPVSEDVFPAEQGLVKKNFTWKFKGVNYSLPLTLHSSTYDYYKKQPKTFSYIGTIPENWQDQYYGMFLKSNSKDDTIKNVAESLKQQGVRHKLSDDQIVDLVMAFVQSIPYDDARANEILSQSGDVAMQYPYETLYLQKGVCSDKTLLADVVLKQLGYGTAIFTYEKENHMALGIQCAQKYSTYGSGYCYAETTSSGNKIGIIPSFDSNSNKTVDAFDLVGISATSANNMNLRELGTAEIFSKSQGRIYNGISDTMKIVNEISSLKTKMKTYSADLKASKMRLDAAKSSLDAMHGHLNDLKSSQNYAAYNDLAQKYNEKLEAYRKQSNDYNDMVNLYNQAVKRYNTLITQ